MYTETEVINLVGLAKGTEFSLGGGGLCSAGQFMEQVGLRAPPGAWTGTFQERAPGTTSSGSKNTSPVPNSLVRILHSGAKIKTEWMEVFL